MPTRPWKSAALLAATIEAGAPFLWARSIEPPAAPPAPTAPAVPTAPAQLPAPPELVRPADLVSAQRGDLPIILSAPHGGGVRIPGSTGRTRGVTVRDLRTAEAALLTAQRLTERLGAKPYFVIAQFSRKDADANRAPDDGQAFENDPARAAYDAYHAALRAAVDECRARFGVAILIDLHGQARVPGAIVRGTRNGKTVESLLRRHGPAALTGPDSLFGRLKAAGYTVLPDLPPDPNGADAKADAPDPQPEPDADAPAGRETFLDGGYIVAAYGSHTPHGVDAIQVELGAQRTDDLLKLARTLGDCIAGFYESFIRPDIRPEPRPAR
ncbi:MAG: N-formylglutamate amidohydrolase [Phycisphaerae bacterium]|nr:N-formylglutamate amidohydrolase [Phycisphaerae bacterium]